MRNLLLPMAIMLLVLCFIYILNLRSLCSSYYVPCCEGTQRLHTQLLVPHFYSGTFWKDVFDFTTVGLLQKITKLNKP